MKNPLSKISIMPLAVSLASRHTAFFLSWVIPGTLLFPVDGSAFLSSPNVVMLFIIRCPFSGLRALSGQDNGCSSSN